MYVKPPRRQLHGTYVPDNYNGTAFSDPQDEQEMLDPQPQAPEPTKEPISLSASAVAEKGTACGDFCSNRMAEDDCFNSTFFAGVHVF